MINDPIAIMLVLFIMGLLPIILVLTTSFIKISMILMMTRESLGVQQAPQNIVIYGISMILSIYIMAPVYNNAYFAVQQDINNHTVITSTILIDDFKKSIVPIKQFLNNHSMPSERDFFYKSLHHYWTPDMLVSVEKNDLLILIPAFVISELTQAFKIGFLIYLPSIIIDIIVSNILMAMGMMMMSPVTISLPIKLLLFISIDGWTRLIHVILGTYG